MTERPASGATTAGGAGPRSLDDLLIASLTALAAAGEVEEACRLAGHACALHRNRDVPAWNRYNVLLHRLAKKASGAHQVAS